MSFVNLAFKIRHVLTTKKSLFSLLNFSGSGKVGTKLNPNDQIVVVGIGVAAFTVVNSLKSLGFKNVKVVARDKFYGGKCVNFGCMPIEYLFQLDQQDPQRLQKTLDFTSGLRKSVEQQFASAGYDITFDEAIEVRDQKLILKSGQRLAFDKLILTTGMTAQHQGPSIAPEKIWGLKPGRVCIWASDEPNALAVAELAKRLGHEVYIVTEKSFSLNHLPSFKFYKQSILNQGIACFEKAYNLRQNDQSMSFGHQGKGVEREFDYLINLDSSVSEILKVDGKAKGVLDLNLNYLNLTDHQNIYFAGDKAGGLSATEAEFQATQLVESMLTGKEIDQRALSQLPLRFHGQSSWASAGGYNSLFNRDWKELSFNNLGWTAVHSQPGSLWYKFNRETAKIEALQICHHQASELIGIASVLMELPVTDNRWINFSVHPSSTEIFSHLARMLRLEVLRPEPVIVEEKNFSYVWPTLPKIESYLLEHNFVDRLNLNKIYLSKNPQEYLGVLYAACKLSKVKKIDSSVRIDQQGVPHFAGDITWRFQKSPMSLDLQVDQTQVRLDSQI
ncbi:hypothetical protein CIK05_08940 [Bdellovibrio sp. qaytius]|nr:hypothetical protein CIK05_08940 [Bdellovibrio sp. qaytius]